MKRKLEIKHPDIIEFFGCQDLESFYVRIETCVPNLVIVDGSFPYRLGKFREEDCNNCGTAVAKIRERFGKEIEIIIFSSRHQSDLQDIISLHKTKYLHKGAKGIGGLVNMLGESINQWKTTGS
jgi:hypothetical protein